MALNEKLINIYTVLPTERYLKKFLDTKVTVDPSYTLSQKDKFGSFLYVSLDKTQYQVCLNEKRFNDQIKIEFPIAYEREGRFEFKGETIHLVNNFLKCWFHEEFVAHMKLCNMFSLPMDRSIQSFCNINGIDLDIDIQYDSLKKKYYRWREKNGQPLSKYLLELLQEN